MKIVTYLLAALLCAALVAAALFYFSTFQPMAAAIREAATRLHSADQQAPKATGTRRKSTSPKVTAH
jgi:Na+/H+ antiporter NhaC